MATTRASTEAAASKIRVTTIEFGQQAQSLELDAGAIVADVIAEGSLGNNVILEHNGTALDVNTPVVDRMVIKVKRTDSQGRVEWPKKIAGNNDDDDYLSIDEDDNEFDNVEGTIVVTIEKKRVQVDFENKVQVEEGSTVATLLRDANVGMSGIKVKVNGAKPTSLGQKLVDGDVVEVLA